MLKIREIARHTGSNSLSLVTCVQTDSPRLTVQCLFIVSNHYLTSPLYLILVALSPITTRNLVNQNKFLQPWKAIVRKFKNKDSKTTRISRQKSEASKPVIALFRIWHISATIYRLLWLIPRRGKEVHCGYHFFVYMLCCYKYFVKCCYLGRVHEITALFLKTKYIWAPILLFFS